MCRVPWLTPSRYQIAGALRNEARNPMARNKNFPDGCKATAPPPNATRPKN
jgi:hypothetical protein